ncbi:MAG TPA: DegT/DnrJ/EryC1/StrS family aminotransferase [Candidatus Eisenbacteria bacterium]|nr:DegT/DnrJ/EryC1/StrS family aminotransferase [Candidatus Eisenbacteria bacterium]
MSLGETHERRVRGEGRDAGGPRRRPKIGVEEFLSVAERFGFPRATLARIRAAVSDEELGEGPFLGSHGANLPETKVQAFERRALRTFGSRFALGVSSGTAALHAAFVAAGVGPGTEVICPAIGFLATPATVVLAKGVPVFCDVDESLGMDPARLEKLITPRTVAIAPTHVMGSVCDLGAIVAVARRFGLKVVEDCAQSCGATYRGRPVGTHGDVGCFSISAAKIVGGGEGGLLLTDNQRLYERACGLAECGGLWRPERFAPPRWDGELFSGTNYRMSELEAAVDVVQLGKLPAIVGRFRAVRRRVVARLGRYAEIRPQKRNDPDGEIGYALRFFPATLELGARVVARLRAARVACSFRGAGAPPDAHVYHSMFAIVRRVGTTPDDCAFGCPVYRTRGGSARYARGDCPVADDLFDRMLHVPLDQWWSGDECRAVGDAIEGALAACCTPDPRAPAWA